MLSLTTVVLALAPQIFALTINTPSSVTQCEPTQLTWSNGTAPYYIAVIPGGDTTSAALKTFDTTSSESLTWTVDIESGTSITIRAKDSTGDIAYTDAVTIGSGSDSSCISSSTAGSASYGATSSGASTATSGSTSTSSKSGSSTTSSAASTATQDSDSASAFGAISYGAVFVAISAILL